MTRFMETSDLIRYNVDEISAVDERQGVIILTFRDGSTKTFHAEYPPAYVEEILGCRHVVQVLPCAEPMCIVYENEDSDSEDGPYVEPFYYLGLCADGRVRALVFAEGHFDTLEDTDEVHICREADLDEVARGRHEGRWPYEKKR